VIAATRFRNLKVALFGLGGSGLATAHALREGGAQVLAWDDNPDQNARAASEGIGVANLAEIDWSDVASFVLSPGVPLTHPRPHWTVPLAQAAGVEIIGDIELFSRERTAFAPTAPLVAITGTNGKSTTTALIGHILRHSGRDTQVGGNIGKAVMTLDPAGEGRFHVLECSSYQIDLAPSLAPSAGILLNLTPDHLDRHGTMEHYAEVKERLVAASDHAIIGVDDDYCRAIADRLEADGRKVVRISVRGALDNGYFADREDLVLAEGGNRRVVASLTGTGSLRGRHNAQNALAAVAACRVLGLSDADIQAWLSTFPGLAHRMEMVARKRQVLFVNDSKATNAEASAPALSSFERIYWIAGGLPKTGGIETLGAFFPRIARAYLIGEAAPSFAATLGTQTPYEIAGTLDVAVRRAAQDASEDQSAEAVVLLSPACASFDQFRNFEVRGDAFREAVLALDGIEPIGGPH
jgi:UDP-N-acetylmuramoylalanine--D-glutamate ligase